MELIKRCFLYVHFFYPVPSREQLPSPPCPLLPLLSLRLPSPPPRPPPPGVILLRQGHGGRVDGGDSARQQVRINSMEVCGNKYILVVQQKTQMNFSVLLFLIRYEKNLFLSCRSLLYRREIIFLAGKPELFKFGNEIASGKLLYFFSFFFSLKSLKYLTLRMDSDQVSHSQIYPFFKYSFLNTYFQTVESGSCTERGLLSFLGHCLDHGGQRLTELVGEFTRIPDKTLQVTYIHTSFICYFERSEVAPQASLQKNMLKGIFSPIDSPS